jgi:hypothetical protein
MSRVATGAVISAGAETTNRNSCDKAALVRKPFHEHSYWNNVAKT